LGVFELIGSATTQHHREEQAHHCESARANKIHLGAPNFFIKGNKSSPAIAADV
jgi:hypothetical protein